MTTLDRTGTLTRFHAAHVRNHTFERALREIRAGDKQTHWMWFIFPQLAVLAKSEISRYYGITDRAEAAAYFNDPVLRLRLYQCTDAVLRHNRLMFAYPDNHKLRSCMTLFAQVADDPALPNAVIAKFFSGPDRLTLDALAGKPIVLPKRPAGKPYVRPAAKQQAYEALAEARRWRSTGSWSRDRVTSFVRSFGLSSIGTRQMVDAWMADQERAREEGHEEGRESYADSAYYDTH